MNGFHGRSAALAVWLAGALAGALAMIPTGLMAAPETAPREQFIPHLVYRTGPYAANGIPFADGVADYYTLINQRDGGINGVRIVFEECDTGYDTERGLECYERLKGKGPTGAAAFMPVSTGLANALIEPSRRDRIPLFTTTTGRAETADGRVFPFAFSAPDTYWTGIAAVIAYIADDLGGGSASGGWGLAGLKGRRIAYVHLDNPFGREPLVMLDALQRRAGFVLKSFPIAPPGLDQRAAWLSVARQFQPDYTIMWGYGAQNAIALGEAAAAGVPRGRLIGGWWSGSEEDVVPAGAAALGYKALALHTPGTGLKVLGELSAHVLALGRASGGGAHFGTVLYNRGVFNAAMVVEAIRTAQDRFGPRPLTGEETQWGFDNLNLTAARLARLGFAGFVKPFRLSCADHEGRVPVRVQEWTGLGWRIVSDWIEPDRAMIARMVEDAADRYAEEHKITPRTCW